MRTLYLDILQFIENEDGTCDVKFEMNENTKYALVQYALKRIIIEAAETAVEENKEAAQQLTIEKNKENEPG